MIKMDSEEKGIRVTSLLEILLEVETSVPSVDSIMPEYPDSFRQFLQEKMEQSLELATSSIEHGLDDGCKRSAYMGLAGTQIDLGLYGAAKNSLELASEFSEGSVPKLVPYHVKETAELQARLMSAFAELAVLYGWSSVRICKAKTDQLCM